MKYEPTQVFPSSEKVGSVCSGRVYCIFRLDDTAEKFTCDKYMLAIAVLGTNDRAFLYGRNTTMLPPFLERRFRNVVENSAILPILFV